MIAGIVARIRSLWSGATRGPALDEEMRAEFEHHMELRAADLVRSGTDPQEAMRRARAEFGGTHNYTEVGREARGLRWFDAVRVSWLDVKLGARMIRRYPGLTLVGSLAMGVAIAIGAAVMGVITLIKDPSLPLHEGERIVGIQVWNIQSNNPSRQILRDFAIWNEEMRTVRDMGVFRSVTRVIGASDGRAEPARAAEMTASGFRVARVSPLLGRYLLEADEREGAPRVAVLSHQLWTGRFGADSGIVGTSVLISGVPHTVVGVMPPGFAWPVSYTLWLPLRVNPVEHAPRTGPAVFAFGRLADGVTLEQARVEMQAVGDRVAREFPETHELLRPQLLPFAQSWFELDGPDSRAMFAAAQLAVVLLLLIICVNIAILVYARTATRQGEIAVRSALGASRSRIVAQLLGEALVLAGVGAVIGLGIIQIIASQVRALVAAIGATGIIPFWVRLEVSPATIGYLIALAVMAAVVIGVVPALQVTGRRVQASLQRLTGGHASVRMGRLWTTLIVVEVALTVAILPTAGFFVAESVEAMVTGPGFPAEEYLSAELLMDRETLAAPATTEMTTTMTHASRFGAQREELMRRLRLEPDVVGVTWSAALPGVEGSELFELDDSPVRFEVDPVVSSYGRWDGNARRARHAEVDPGFFDVFAAQPVVGRTFVPADAGVGGAAVVVNRVFVDSILGGGNPIGRKVRVLRQADGKDQRGPWKEVVGVVPNIPAHLDFERPSAIVYEATRSLESALLTIRLRGTDPGTFSARLRALTADVHPALFLRKVQPLSDVLWESHLPLRLVAATLVAVAGSVLVLSAAGLYALMSVIVTQRRREIGIRIALGADRRRVLVSIFSRAALQVGTGVAVGLVIAFIALQGMKGEMPGFSAVVILPFVAIFMLGVGILSALGPARRGLAIQPSVVLKED